MIDDPELVKGKGVKRVDILIPQSHLISKDSEEVRETERPKDRDLSTQKKYRSPSVVTQGVSDQVVHTP